MADEEDFLSRWSRRKRRDVPEKPEATELPPEPDPVAEPETEEEEAALLEQLGLPKPETLGPGDDFRPFMNAGVPEFLRRRALRVLWRSNPVLANLDGLNDYDDDFTSPELTKKVLATAYQVGRGIISRNVEQTGPAQPVSEDVPEASEQEQTVELALSESESLPNPEPRTAYEPDEPAPKPRRMRFDT